MKFTFEELNNGDLDNLAKEVNLDEKIDYGCQFVVARKNDKIIGVAGVSFIKNIVPRFEHIIIAPEYQKTKLGGVLMKRTEEWLKSLGYAKYNAFIFYGKDLMRHYARKFGMVETTHGNKGSWFIKYLTKEREYAFT